MTSYTSDQFMFNRTTRNLVTEASCLQLDIYPRSMKLVSSHTGREVMVDFQRHDYDREGDLIQTIYYPRPDAIQGINFRSVVIFND